MKKIDLLGFQCPAPVIETKKALKENNSVEVLVDNEISAQNLKKLSDQYDYDYQMNRQDNNVYSVKISQTKGSLKISEEAEETTEGNHSGEYTVLITDDKMGGGDEKLGRTLLKGFIYALTEQDIMPKQILFYNAGVHLVTEESEALEDLEQLEEAGVEILACGLCLDFYNIKDKVAAGSVTNMYSIVETLRTSSRIVRP